MSYLSRRPSRGRTKPPRRPRRRLTGKPTFSAKEDKELKKLPQADIDGLKPGKKGPKKQKPDVKPKPKKGLFG